MTELSIIIPYANEFPQVLFTIRDIAEELLGRVDFEIIAVNNYCPELEAQTKARVALELERVKKHLVKTRYKPDGQLKTVFENALAVFDEDRGGGSIKACSRGHKWLKYIEYQDKLSHWNAKRVGCEAAEGEYLMFIDAHCIVGRDSIYNMFNYYKEFEDQINGSLHLPLTYKILEWHRLMYKLVVHDDANGNPAEFKYSFTTFKPEVLPYELPCMSTCGMMLSRKIYDRVGGWPEQLGIYGGGEHFMNFTLSVLGHKKWIYPSGYLCHHGEKRGYYWNYDDNIRNRIIATYLFGGEVVARRFITIAKGKPQVLELMLNEAMKQCKKQREHRKKNQVMSIDNWSIIWR
jgi:hypothetical protein